MAGLETFKLGGLNLNDGTKFSIQELTFTPAAPKPLWASNASADGDALVEEPHFTNSTFDVQVRVRQTASKDAALVVVGELMDKLQSCAKADGGEFNSTWTPAESTRSYFFVPLVGELAEVPITPTGELAGWFIKSPVLKIKLTCRPFLYGESRVVKSLLESGAEPLQEVYVKEVKGDVPAEAQVVVLDKATKDRRYLEWGREIVASEAGNPALLITAKDLIITNFTGTSTTRAGGYPDEAGVGKVKRGTAIGEPTTICGTGFVSNVGTFRVYARVYAASSAARFRLSSRHSEGAFQQLAFVQPPALENFSRIYLGEVSLELKSELRIEVKSSTGEPIEVDVNYLELIPSLKGSARARGLATNDPNKLIAYDTFLQAEANLDLPVALPLGGNWAEASKTGAAGFKVIAAEDLARRTEVSDANVNSGCYALAGAEEPTTCKVSIDLKMSLVLAGGLFSERFRGGVLLRYTNTENWLMAALETFGDTFRLKVYKRVAGTVTTLATGSFFSPGSLINEWMRVSCLVGSDGAWQARAYVASSTTEPEALLEGQDSALATGGALAKGKGGFYDAWTSATANTRTYDNFSLLIGEPAHKVCLSTKAVVISTSVEPEPGTEGLGRGEALVRGSSFYLEPAGGAGRINRLVVLMRRNDVEAEVDGNVTDKQAVEILANERYLTPR